MDLALFMLVQLVVVGAWLGARRRPVTARTLACVGAWFLAFHLGAGLWLATAGVDAPRVHFQGTRGQ